ncbi:MAG: Gfo/Idh/MocA family oxidoreductase [Pseudomonadota bacterium]
MASLRLCDEDGLFKAVVMKSQKADHSRLRWGIMGAGWIAARFAADLRYGTTGRVGQIASRDPARASEMAGRFDASAADSYAALAASDQVDAIYVATPAQLHREHCLLALSHGKPVLCEKPLATSAADAREIAKAAQVANVFCMEAMWTRFLPVFSEIRDHVRQGAVGEISQFSAEIGFPVEESAETAAITSSAMGGGALLDLGIYGVSMAHDLLGSPQEVSAIALTSPSDAVRDVMIALRYQGNGRSTLASVRASHSTKLGNRLELAGNLGRICVATPFIQANHAKLHPVVTTSTRSQSDTSVLKDLVRGSLLWRLARPIAQSLTGRSLGASFRGYGLWFEAEEVAHCVGNGYRESPIMPLSQSIAVLETMDLARQALTVEPEAMK